MENLIGEIDLSYFFSYFVKPYQIINKAHQEYPCIIGDNLFAIDHLTIDFRGNLRFINFADMMQQTPQRFFSGHVGLEITPDARQQV